VNKIIGFTYWFGTHNQNYDNPKSSYELFGR